MTYRFFFNRRSGIDRRQAQEQRLNPRLDLSHKRRRKTDERRGCNRLTTTDIYTGNHCFGSNDNKHPPKH